MRDLRNTSFADRQKASAEAKKALLENLRPKPTRIDPQHAERASLRAAELERVRQDRAAAKAAKIQAAAEAAEALQKNQDAEAAAALETKRTERKERKALSNAEAKAKRDARYAARKARN